MNYSKPYQINKQITILVMGFFVSVLMGYAFPHRSSERNAENDQLNTVLNIAQPQVLMPIYTFQDACASLITPMNGALNVPVTTTIDFMPVPGAVNHFVDLGTTPGGTDILDNFSAGINGAFTPPLGLPETTLIYITVRGFFPNGTTTTCDPQSFTTEDVTSIPACTQLIDPEDGSIDVSIETTALSWAYALRATGYIITMGTTPGGTDVIAGEDVGNTLNYTIPFDLDPETTYYVTIIPYNENGQNTSCINTSFTTETVASELPACTQLIAPVDGEVEVALTPILQWAPVPTATGYFIKVGSFPGGGDVLSNTNIGNTTSTVVLEFTEGTTYFVTITPYNGAGTAVGCTETSFTTTFGCGPYEDAFTGEITDLNPVIDLADTYNRCSDEPPITLTYPDTFTTIAWKRITDGSEIVIETGNTVTIEETGFYQLEVNLEVAVEAGFIICTTLHDFTVTVHQAPVISNLQLTNQGSQASVLVELTNEEGDFEYSSVSAQGPYQDSPLLTGLDFTDIQIFVRDRNGCGIDSRTLSADPGFPKYFTPNGDGINDTWQVRGRTVQGETITSIEIYDRYGKRLITLLPHGDGWDGTYGGRALFDQGFWYKASTTSNIIFTGYFALRRF